MITPIGLICSSLIALSVLPAVRTQPAIGTGVQNTIPGSRRERGLCREGWTQGSFQTPGGREVAVCLRVNTDALGWQDARDACRENKGFLLKLDTPVRIDGIDLLRQLQADGFSNIWTGLHTENNHIVWDDIAPNQVTAVNGNNDTLSKRPWTWDDRDIGQRQEYCGSLDVRERSDDSKKRRKRSPEDTADSDFSQMFSSDNDSPSTNSRFAAQNFGAFRNSEFNGDNLETAAFQSMSARTRMSDHLEELPGRVLALRSPLQAQAAGTQDSNMERGGLETVVPPHYGITRHPPTQPTAPDTESEPLSDSAVSELLQNLGSTDHTAGLQTMGQFGQGASFNHPTPSPDLMRAVRDQAESLGVGTGLHYPTARPTGSMTENNSPAQDTGADTNQGLFDALERLINNGETGNPTRVTELPSVGNADRNRAGISGSIHGSSQAALFDNTNHPANSLSNKVTPSTDTDSVDSGADSHASDFNNAKIAGFHSQMTTASPFISNPLQSIVPVANPFDLLRTTSNNNVQENPSELLEKLTDAVTEPKNGDTLTELTEMNKPGENIGILNNKDSSDAVEKAVDIVKDVNEKISDRVGDIIDNVKDHISEAMSGIGNVGLPGPVFPNIRLPTFSNIQDTLSGTDASADLPKPKQFVESVKETLSETVPNPSEALDSLADSLSDVGQSLENVNEAVSEVADRVTDKLTENIPYLKTTKRTVLEAAPGIVVDDSESQSDVPGSLTGGPMSEIVGTLTKVTPAEVVGDSADSSESVTDIVDDYSDKVVNSGPKILGGFQAFGSDPSSVLDTLKQRMNAKQNDDSRDTIDETSTKEVETDGVDDAVEKISDIVKTVPVQDSVPTLKPLKEIAKELKKLTPLDDQMESPQRDSEDTAADTVKDIMETVSETVEDDSSNIQGSIITSIADELENTEDRSDNVADVLEKNTENLGEIMDKVKEATNASTDVDDKESLADVVDDIEDNVSSEGREDISEAGDDIGDILQTGNGADKTEDIVPSDDNVEKTVEGIVRTDDAEDDVTDGVTDREDETEAVDSLDVTEDTEVVDDLQDDVHESASNSTSRNLTEQSDDGSDTDDGGVEEIEGNDNGLPAAEVDDVTEGDNVADTDGTVDNDDSDRDRSGVEGGVVEGDDLDSIPELDDIVSDDYGRGDGGGILSPDDLGDLDDLPDMLEALQPEDEVTAIRKKTMSLSQCEIRLPSVCFTYQIEVVGPASTCDVGWYGHVLLDTCYRALDDRYTYPNSVRECRRFGAQIVKASSSYERTLVLMAVQRSGQFFTGTKFWRESSSAGTCSYFDETGEAQSPCAISRNVLCVKPARVRGVRPAAESVALRKGDVDITMAASQAGNSLKCLLESEAPELPVLWYKDGVLVDIKMRDKETAVPPYIGIPNQAVTPGGTSLSLDSGLLQKIQQSTNREQNLAGLQGRYWCEVWGTRPLSRHRSPAYNLRFADVMSFHGAMALPSFRLRDETLFNMADEVFPGLLNTAVDISQVFRDVLPVLKGITPYVNNVFTFVDRVRSSPHVVEYHTYFSLSRNYTQQEESQVYTRLKGLLRATMGNRNYIDNLPGNTPVSTFRTMSLQSTVACPLAPLKPKFHNGTVMTSSPTFNFPRTQVGESAVSQEICRFSNGDAAARAVCAGGFYTGAYWDHVTPTMCDVMTTTRATNDWQNSPFTSKLTRMAETTVNADNVQFLMDEVAQIAGEASRLTPTDINKIADVLDHSTQLVNIPVKVGEDVVKTVDKLMADNEKELEIANVETKAANRIIKSLERYAENVDMAESTNMRMVTDNVVVEIWTLGQDTPPVIGLAAESNAKRTEVSFKQEQITTIFNKSQLYEANVDAAIQLPIEAFTNGSKDASSNRLTMMVFRKSKLFEAAALSQEGVHIDRKQLSNLNSYVISASIAGKKLTGLKEKVKTIFKPLTGSNDTRSCVWWDFSRNGQKGGWSNSGCTYDGRVNGRDVCLCDHLTNFAVLLDFYGQEHKLPEHHELSLSIITVIGLSLSILGLALTIISYMFFRKLRQGRAQQTLFNLAVALLCSMLVFLTGVRQTHSYWGCLIVAVLLHYFILSSFLWMLMEAILQYLTFVKVLGTYITRFTLKTVLPAWGLPLIPIIVILSVDYDLYRGGPDYCWMALPAFYYGFAIPISGIILINIIIFIVTIISISRRGQGLRSNQKKQKMAMTNLQAAITSFVLLGLTWLFGYLAIADARLPFQYVFTILNSLQGFFIFILFVIRKKKVREQWYIICCRGGDRDKVSRSLSASNSIPSSYSNGSCRGAERDRSDSTKTTTSTFSAYSNHGYEHHFERPHSRQTYKNF